MNAELKAKWTAALRSGEYKQTSGCLHDTARGTYCCLGVLCRVIGKPCNTDPGISEQSYDAYPDVIKAAIGDTIRDTSKGFTGQLIYKNDGEGLSFPEIADWIDENIPSDVDTAQAA